MSSTRGRATQRPAPPWQAHARLKGSIKKKPEIPKHLLHIIYKSFLSLIPHMPRETALPAPALQIQEERLERPSAALAPHPVGLCRCLPAKAGIHGLEYGGGKPRYRLELSQGHSLPLGLF